MELFMPNPNKKEQRIIKRKLINAVEENNLQEVKDCLNKGADVNAKENDLTFLHYAIEGDNKEIVKVLLVQGADINLRDNDGKTPLMLAESLSNCDQEIVKLLKAHADSQSVQQSDDHKTQLEHVEPFSSQEIITQQGSSTIEIAAKHANVNTFEDLIKLRLPELEGKVSIPENAAHLLKQIDKEGNTLLLIATKNREQDNIGLFIQCGADVNYRNKMKQSAIDLAWEYGYYECMLVLLEGDSNFPQDFMLDSFYNDDDIPLTLKTFVREREELHQWIQEDNLEKVKKFISAHKVSKFLNSKGQLALETAAEHARITTLAALLDLHLPLPAGKISIPENTAHLLKQVNKEGDTALLIAAKNGKQDHVDFFIKCGADINHCNNLEKSAIDLAWENNYYDTVLVLLKVDSDFPKGVKFDEENEFTQKFKTFFDDREKLHTSIQEGNLEKVKKFILNNKVSVFYLNSQSKSALFTAIEERQYEIYAFLKSINAKFKDEQEQKCMNLLNELQRNSLKELMVRYCSPVKNAHVLYLVSKSRSLGSVENFEEEVKRLYQDLDDIPEISTILKVIQYIDYVDIIFDFNKDSTIDVDPTSSETTKGHCDYKIGRLYIGAKVDRCELLGTLAHELTHLAMQIIYCNDCNPYDKSEDEKELEFNNIIETVKKTIESTPTKIDEIIKRVFTVYWNTNDWPSELVVRIPHIYAKYGRERGGEIISQQVPQLLDYYEKNVIPNCEEFIQQHFLIKPRNNIRLLNQISGVINNIVESEIQFKKSIDLDDFLNNQDKKILLLNTKSTWLSSINIYQSLQKTSLYSSFDSYLFFKFDRYNKQQVEIHKALYSEASNLLVVEYPSNSDNKQLTNVLNDFSELLSKKSDKKIIFITQESDVPQFEEKLKKANLSDRYSGQKDQEFKLKDLTVESQKKLLEKEVTFQGRKISLNKLIDENLKELIDSETLVKLINDEETKIGNELTISSGYDKDYYIERTFNHQIEIKLKTFKAKENYDLLAISGSGINKATISELMVKGEKIHLFNENDPNKNNPIRFIVLDNQEAEEQFKELCKQYPARNIHWLKREAAKFIWQKSQGTISNLIRYREENKDYNYDGKEMNLKEEDLVTYDNQHKIVIISDTAGMGKSTVLTNLSTHIKNKFHNLWVVRIDLNDYSKVLDEELKKRESNNSSFNIHDTNGNSAVEFLLNEILESGEKSRLQTSLEKELFKHSFKYQGKITVMFDGFDEISPTYKEVVMDLLQALRNTAVNKLWVTTRPNIRQELEEKLEVFAYTLESFSENNQIEFLTKFWKKKLDLNDLNQECLVIYAKTLIDKFCTSISDREKEFTGIPLQMRMVAEIFQENKEGTQEEWQGCKEFLTAYNENEPKLPERLDLLGLYEHFVKKKFYDFYLQEKQIIPDFTKQRAKKLAETSYKEFKEKHELLALHRLLKDKDLTELLSTEEIKRRGSCIEDIKNCEENQGIIDQIIYDKAHFIHLTFAEYFASSSLVERMFSKSTTTLKCIDSIIANTSPVFINSIIKLLDTKETEIDGLLEGKTLLNLVTQKGYLNFVKALLEAGCDNYPEPDNLDKTPLHYAAESGHSAIVKYLLNYNDDILEDDILEHGSFKKEECADSKLVKFVNKKDKNANTAVYYAAAKNNMDIACDLLLKGADSDALREYIKPITLYVAEETRSAYANQDHKLRPIEEKLLIQAPDAVSDFDKHYEYPRLLSYFFVHGRIQVIIALLNSIIDKEKKKCLLNAVSYFFVHGRFQVIIALLNSIKDKKKKKSLLNAVSYFFVHGRIQVIIALLNRIKDKEKKKSLLNAVSYFFVHGRFQVIIALLNSIKEKKKKKSLLNAVSYFFVHGRIQVIIALLNRIKDKEKKKSLLNAVSYFFVHGCIQVNSIKDKEKKKSLHNDVSYFFVHGRIQVIIALLNSIKDKEKKKCLLNAVSYFFVHGRSQVIIALLNSIKYKDIKKSLLNAEDNSYTPLDRVNLSDELSDDDRLAITKYLLENGGIEAEFEVGHSFKNTNSNRYITKILQAAAQRGHIKTFKYFIDQENPNNYYLHSYWAAQHDQFNIIQYLLENHRENIKHDGNTALHTAVDSGASLKMIKYYIEDINAKNDKSETPLFHAIYANRRLNVIKYLVDHKADVNIQDNKGNTALYYAIEDDQRDTIKYLLLECKAEIGLTSELMIQNKVEFFRNPSEFNLNFVDQNGMPRLHYAIKFTDLEWSKFLIRQGADINMKDQEGKTPLHLASWLQQTEIVELLLQYGAIYDEIDINNNTPLDLLSQAGLNLDKCKIFWLLNIFKKLFSSQHLLHDLNEKLLSTKQGRLKDWGPYGSGHADAWDGDNPMLFIPNVRNAEGKTLVHIAADTSDIRAIGILLKFNHDYLERKTESRQFPRYKDYQSISMDAMDSQGNTPLHLAAQKGYGEVVSFLLKKGAIFNVKNNEGQTPEKLADNNHHDNVIKLLQLTKSLFDAVEQNNLVKVKQCINKRAYVNVKDENGKTPLHFAVSSDQSDIVQFLLKHGANIEAIDSHNQTPLHFATKNNKIEIVKLLLKHGAIFDAKDKEDKAPFELENNQSVNLLDAINKLFNDIQSDNPHVIIDNLETVQKDYEIDISTISNILDNQGNIILHYAANYFDIVQFLLQNGAIFDAQDLDSDHQDIINLRKSVVKMFDNVDVIFQKAEKVDVQIIINVRNEQGRTLLHKAAVSGKLKVVKWLVEHGANINARDNDGKTVLHLTASEDHLEVMKYLAEKAPDVNVTDNDGMTVLHWAAKAGNLEVVELLVDNGANINVNENIYGKTPLHFAAREGWLNIVTYLVKTLPEEEKVTVINTPASKNGATPLHYAAGRGKLDVAKYLIEEDADVNAVDHSCRTPLHCAAQEGRLNIVTYLIETLPSEKQVDVNIAVSYGVTPLHFAFRGQLKIAKYLINKGANINAVGFNGKTPLHFAAEKNQLNVVKYLIERDANVNALDKNDKTPLHYAVQTSNLEMVEILIEQGAVVAVIDQDGKTPLVLAKENDHEITNYLIKCLIKKTAQDLDVIVRSIEGSESIESLKLI